MSDDPNNDPADRLLADLRAFSSAASEHMPAAPWPPAVREDGRCRCCAVTVDGRARTLTCRECKRPVDPISWILEVTRGWESIEAELEQREHRIADLDRQIAARVKVRDALTRAKTSGRIVDVPPPPLPSDLDRTAGPWIRQALEFDGVVAFRRGPGWPKSR